MISDLCLLSSTGGSLAAPEGKDNWASGGHEVERGGLWLAGGEQVEKLRPLLVRVWRGDSLHR